MPDRLKRCKVILDNRRKCGNKFIGNTNRSYCKIHAGSKKVKEQNEKKRRMRYLHSDSDFI